MNKSKELRWRRQFLLARGPIKFLRDWKDLKIGSFYLYAHPDLEINSVSDSNKTVVLIGYLFDPVEVERNNSEILAHIVSHSQSFEEFVMNIKPYAGRYVFLYRDNDRCTVLQDALALREVYYCTKNNLIVCGSQPNLIAQFAVPEIGVTSDLEIQDFYRNHFRNSKWIGDDTYYENVKHLLPNHCLDVNTLTALRYWPTERIKRLPLEDAVARSCDFLRGIMRAASSRHSLMLAVTAGTDSRTILAASRHITDRIYFFVNKERDLTDRSPDIRIPKAIFAKLRLPFHVHTIPNEVDHTFREIFLNNTFFASERILPTIYNAYFKNHSHKVNILGIGEIGRTRYGKQPRRLNGYRMAYALGYKDSEYAIKECRRVLPEMLAVGNKFGVNAMTLLYWEQTMGNWGAVGNSESDIAIEEFDPYNSHLLYETFLAVHPKYANYATKILFRQMIKRMWPELLQWPINPPADNLQEKIKFFLKKIRFYSGLKRLKYRVDHARYSYFLERNRL
jgi:hypothetical protein